LFILNLSITLQSLEFFGTLELAFSFGASLDQFKYLENLFYIYLLDLATATVPQQRWFEPAHAAAV
jgi:hypothetical protein